MGNEPVKVIDATGIERTVMPCDAREIIAAGGSWPDGKATVPDLKEKPKAKDPAAVIPEEAETETVEVFESDGSGDNKSLGKVTRPKKVSKGSK